MATKNETKYTKKQIINSKTLNYNKDVLEILLGDEILYTKKEVEKIYNDFLKKEVK